VVLFIAFGSLLAMLLPIVTAIAGVVSGLMAIAPLTHTMSVVTFVPILGALIGLGVGTDYALFIVTRHRRGLQSGLAPEDAAVTAVDTSGRAVLFAGGTVCIAILGILVLGLSFLNGLAVACALTVVCTVLAAVTLLPALLGVFGWRVLSRRQRRRLANQRGTQDAGGVVGALGGHGRTQARCLGRHGRGRVALDGPGRGRRVDSGPGVAGPKSRCSGCEPAALATEPFPGCPPGPAAARRASAFRCW
jgi:hypothetical protein